MPARGLYARKNPPSLTNTTLADGKAARTRSPLRCFCHAHHSDHYRQHDFKGDILTLIKEAENYILKNIRIGMKPDGLVRVDVPEIDREAFHEAISTLFATATTGIRTMSAAPPAQTVLMCGIPAGSWMASPRRLKTSKVSRRRNPLIADLLRRIRIIAAWGRSIPWILEKEPSARFSEIAGIFITEFPRPKTAGDCVEKSQPCPYATRQVSEEVECILYVVREEMSRQEIKSALALLGRGNFEARYLNPALEAAFIERTIPNKPDSSHKKTTSQKKAGNSQPQLIIQPILNAEF